MRPPIRYNVLFVIGMILVMVLAAFGFIWKTEVDPTTVLALVGIAVGPMGMVCKELLTEPPPPSVPADTVDHMIDVMGNK